MGVKAGSLYGLGVQLGVASYFASVNQTLLAKNAVQIAQGFVNELVNDGILTAADRQKLMVIAPNPTQTGLEQVRGDFSATLAGNPNHDFANVFGFGVGVGIAEGQSTGGTPAALSMAKNSMQNCANFEKLLLNYGLVPVTDKHDVISMLRDQWQTRFSDSPLG
jgi:hypothetical protein